MVRTAHSGFSVKTAIAAEACRRACLERAEEMARVNRVEAVCQVVAAGCQVEWGANAGNAADDFAGGMSLFAGPLEQCVPAERNAGYVQRLPVIDLAQAAQDPVDFRRVTGMVGARLAVQLARAAAKMRQGQAPADLPAGLRGRNGVMAARTAFQAVKKDQQRCICTAIEMIDVDEVAIRRCPAFAPQGQGAGLDEQGPEGLGVPAGQPGRRLVMFERRFQCSVCEMPSAMAWWPSSAAEACRLTSRQPWAPRT